MQSSKIQKQCLVRVVPGTCSRNNSDYNYNDKDNDNGKYSLTCDIFSRTSSGLKVQQISILKI